MTESVTLALIMGAQGVLLAAISRLRFKCYSSEDTGKCICLSGCSEVPLQASHDAVDAHEYTIGDGSRVLLVSGKS